ncbi:hypothetical protein Tco_0399446, partial [Tanacetum coccineum]
MAIKGKLRGYIDGRGRQLDDMGKSKVFGLQSRARLARAAGVEAGMARAGVARVGVETVGMAAGMDRGNSM